MSNNASVQQRLDKLERQNRILKLTTFGLVIAFGFIVCAGAATVQSVRELKIVGRTGTERAFVGVQGRASATMRLSDTQGNPQIRMSTATNGPTISLQDSEKNVRAEMRLNKYDNNVDPTIALYNLDNKRVSQLVAMGGGEDTYSALSFFDRNGKIRIEIGVADTRPFLVFYDEKGREIKNLGN